MINQFALKYKNEKSLQNDKSYYENLNKDSTNSDEKLRLKKLKMKNKKQISPSKNDSSTYAQSLQNLSESFVTIKQANVSTFDSKNINSLYRVSSKSWYQY